MANKNEQKESGGLVFEMENVALNARRIRYEVLAGIFKEQKIDFSEVEFSRFCLGRPDDYLPALLERVGYTSASAETVAERLRGETLSRLMQKDCTMDPALKSWLDEAAKREMPIAAITTLPKEAADDISKRLGFDKWNVQVVSSSEGKCFATPAGWGRAALAISRRPFHCAAIVTGSSWARAALAAGYKGIAVPDDFTAFENFAGMDYIVSSLKELKANETLDKLGL